VVDHDDTVDLLVRVELGDLVSDGLRVGVFGPLAEPLPALDEVVAAERQARASAAADREPADLEPLAAQLPPESEGGAQDRRVERAGEAAVGGDRHDRDAPHLAALE